MTPNRAQVQQYNSNAVNYIFLVMVAKPNANKTLPGAATSTIQIEGAAFIG